MKRDDVGNSTRPGAIIIGASAGIGRSVGEELAHSGYDLLLAARGKQDLDAIAKDLSLRFGISTQTLEIDLNDTNFSGKSFAQKSLNLLPNASILIITAGVADDEDVLQLNEEKFSVLIRVNFESPVKVLKAFAELWQAKSANILVCSSIAAGVPRSRNMAYSAAKVGLESYCRSLQHFLFKHPLSVEIIRPGYVDTAMSFGKPLLFPVMSSADAAKIIVKGIHSPRRLRYIPWYWRYIVLVLRALPWQIYAKLKF